MLAPQPRGGRRRGAAPRRRARRGTRPAPRSRRCDASTPRAATRAPRARRAATRRRDAARARRARARARSSRCAVRRVASARPRSRRARSSAATVDAGAGGVETAVPGHRRPPRGNAPDGTPSGKALNRALSSGPDPGHARGRPQVRQDLGREELEARPGEVGRQAAGERVERDAAVGGTCSSRARTSSGVPDDELRRRASGRRPSRPSRPASSADPASGTTRTSAPRTARTARSRPTPARDRRPRARTSGRRSRRRSPSKPTRSGFVDVRVAHDLVGVHRQHRQPQPRRAARRGRHSAADEHHRVRLGDRLRRDRHRAAPPLERLARPRLRAPRRRTPRGSGRAPRARAPAISNSSTR